MSVVCGNCNHKEHWHKDCLTEEWKPCVGAGLCRCENWEPIEEVICTLADHVDEVFLSDPGWPPRDGAVSGDPQPWDKEWRSLPSAKRGDTKRGVSPVLGS